MPGEFAPYERRVNSARTTREKRAQTTAALPSTEGESAARAALREARPAGPSYLLPSSLGGRVLLPGGGGNWDGSEKINPQNAAYDGDGGGSSDLRNLGILESGTKRLVGLLYVFKCVVYKTRLD